MSFSTLGHLGLERSLVLLYIWVEYRDRLFEYWNWGTSLTYDPMSNKISLSCTNSLVTIMVVINHRNIPWGPRCFHQSPPRPNVCDENKCHRNRHRLYIQVTWMLTWRLTWLLTWQLMWHFLFLFFWSDDVAFVDDMAVGQHQVLG